MMGEGRKGEGVGCGIGGKRSPPGREAHIGGWGGKRDAHRVHPSLSHSQGTAVRAADRAVQTHNGGQVSLHSVIVIQFGRVWMVGGERRVREIEGLFPDGVDEGDSAVEYIG